MFTEPCQNDDSRSDTSFFYMVEVAQLKIDDYGKLI